MSRTMNQSTGEKEQVKDLRMDEIIPVNCTFFCYLWIFINGLSTHKVILPFVFILLEN